MSRKFDIIWRTSEEIWAISKTSSAKRRFPKASAGSSISIYEAISIYSFKYIDIGFYIFIVSRYTFSRYIPSKLHVVNLFEMHFQRNIAKRTHLNHILEQYIFKTYLYNIHLIRTNLKQYKTYIYI